MKTFSAKTGEINQDWYLLDAEERVLGRVAAAVAHRLRGKHKAIYTRQTFATVNIRVWRVHMHKNDS